MQAQSKSIADLNKSLQNLAVVHYENYTNCINMDSMTLATGQKLVTILKQQKITLSDSIPNLKILSSNDSAIIVYTFSYDSGGTRGYVDNPVIQWRKKDGSLGAYELFPAKKKEYFGIETLFYKIHKLPSKDKGLYLLIGNEKEDSHTIVGIAIVIQLKNDNLILDYPAFLNQASTLVYVEDLFAEDNLENNVSKTESGDVVSSDDCGMGCIPYEVQSKTISFTMGKNDAIRLVKPNRVFNDDIKQRNIKLYFNGTTFVLK